MTTRKKESAKAITRRGASSLASRPLTMTIRQSSEETETDYPAAWRHIPEERRCEPHLHANLKSRRSFVILYASPIHYCGDQIKEPFSAREEDEMHDEF